MNKNPLAFVQHIQEAIHLIENFTKGLSKDSFLKNKEKQYAVMRALEVVGEATKNLPLSFRNRHPDTPWKKIAGTRDKLIHLYFGVDVDLIWKVVKEEIPVLKKQIQEILEVETKEKDQ